MRGLLAACAALAGFYSITASTAQVVARSNRALAYRLAPYNGSFAALLAASLSGPDATAADRARAGNLARESLLRDPTAVSAVTTLGLNAQLRQDTPGARRLFVYAERLSRRNYEAQLWAIEDAVSRQSVPEALQHYDIALRTNLSRGVDQLYPVLAQAIIEPEVRTGLIRLLAKKSQWGEGFIGYVARKGADPQSVAAMFAGLRRAGVPITEEASAAAIDTALNGGLVDEAWTLYTAVRGGGDRRRGRDPRFAANYTSPTQFDWVPVNDSGVSVSIQRGEKGGLVDFSTATSVGGSLLQQIQILPPGDYRLTGHSAGIQQEPDALPYWALSCRADNRELGRIVVANSAQANGYFAGELTVPVNCPVQVLTLIASPSDAVSGLSGQIDRVELVPTR